MRAATAMRHPRLTVWVLDDGPSEEIARLADRHDARYLSRPDRRGAKAGNMNHALSVSNGDFVAVFDADHAPAPSFLERTLACFDEPRIAFIQTPQSYRNRTENRVAAGAHEQQAIFYGPILRGKDASGSVFSCGTNVVLRRAALDDVGGMPEDSVTEDLRVALMLIRRDWTSRYLPEVLAEGLGPVDVCGYFRQQMRWARGALDILFRRRPFYRGMGLARDLQYALSFIYWSTGWAYLGYLVLPVCFLLFGARPVQVPNQYPAHFLPYMAMTLFTLTYATRFTLTFRTLWFTLASFPVHIAAFFATLTGRAARFAVTSKAAPGRSLAPVWPHLFTLSVLLLAIPVGLLLRGATPSVLNNVAFVLGHSLIVSGFVRLALDPLDRRHKHSEPAAALRGTKAGGGR